MGTQEIIIPGGYVPDDENQGILATLKQVFDIRRKNRRLVPVSRQEVSGSRNLASDVASTTPQLVYEWSKSVFLYLNPKNALLALLMGPHYSSPSMIFSQLKEIPDFTNLDYPDFYKEYVTGQLRLGNIYAAAR